MELLEDTTQLTALVGLNKANKRTVIAVIVKDELKKTLNMIFDGYPSTVVVDSYEVTLGAKAQESYTSEDALA